MKKTLWLLAAILCAAQFTACSDDDDNASKTPKLEKEYFTVENAEYSEEALPAATTDEPISGINMSHEVMSGAMNYITVITNRNYQKFFIAVKDVPGHYVYTPTSVRATDSEEYHSYVIPVMLSDDYQGDATIRMSAQLDNGDITPASEQTITRLETQPGAIEVKLAFSNDKDVDLHMITPSGLRIYFGDRGGTVLTQTGDTVSFGLDFDSNAGCSIDGRNNENIYIPQELVENGEYTVIVDMYANCDPSIPTLWSIVTRYKGALVNVTEGQNPATGTYPVNAGEGDHTIVMKFKVTDGTLTDKTLTDILSQYYGYDDENGDNNGGDYDDAAPRYAPRALTAADKWKLEHQNL